MWITLVFCVMLLYICVISSKPHRLYPPGPTPLPVLGNILSVCLMLRKVKNHFKLWQLWSQQYGEILGLRLGLSNVVVVSGRDYIKEVSSRDVFQGRPDGFLYTMRSFGKKLGVVFSDGPKWMKSRRFILKYLKIFGYNTRFMDSCIEEECRALVKLRTGDAGRAVLVNTMFHVPIVNILWRLVAGKRYDLDDTRLNKLCSLITKLFKAVDMSGGALTFLPFLRYIIPDFIGYTKLRSIHNELHTFIEETIREHRETLDMKHPRDVIDAFLIEANEQNDEQFTQEDLQVICLDLLEAGMETVSNTAAFLLLHIVRNGEVQRKLHEEIDEVIGHARTPTVNDRIRMVYTEAVLLETLRISTVAAVGIPHMALEDAQLGDYVIPKVDNNIKCLPTTLLTPSLGSDELKLRKQMIRWALQHIGAILKGTFVLLAMHDLHNGSHWKDPHVFCPERFLTKEGNIVQDEWLIPFGIGKRRCIGEGLAKTELFMFLTHLLQKFQLSVPDGEPLPSTAPIDGLSLSAAPFKIVFKARF